MMRDTDDDGFTIIEVMIVLAIAGLILLLVFRAVPALQRSSRNNQRKHDASLLLVQRENYDINSGASIGVGEDDCSNAGADNNPDFTSFCGYLAEGMSYYTTDDITLINNGYVKPTTIPTVTPDKLLTDTFMVCNDSGSGATTTGANAHDDVVLYALETGGGQQVNECIQGSLVTSG